MEEAQAAMKKAEEALAKAESARPSWVSDSRLAVIVVGIGLVAVLLIAVAAIAALAATDTIDETIGTVATGALGVVGTIVGAYFGIKVGTEAGAEGKEEVREQAKAARLGESAATAQMAVYAAHASAPAGATLSVVTAEAQQAATDARQATMDAW